MENLSQRDPRWKDIKIGNSTSTIGSLFFGVICFPFRLIPNISTVFRTENVGIFTLSGIKKKNLSTVFTNSLSTFFTIMGVVIRGFKFFVTDSTCCLNVFVSNLKKMMFSFTSTKKFKIFNSIIGLISINVMNTLSTFKLSTQKLFHNISVFKKSFTLYLEKNIAIFSQRFSTFPIRVASTIISFYFVLIGWVVFKRATSRTIFCCKSPITTNFKNFSATLTNYFI